MTFTYLPDGEIGRVRLLVPDRVESEAFFADEEIAAFIGLEGDVFRASAAALETIAADTALVMKAVKIGTFSTNGPAVASALLDRAKALRGRAQEADLAAVGPDGAPMGDFEIAEWVLDPFGYREAIFNDARLEEP